MSSIPDQLEQFSEEELKKAFSKADQEVFNTLDCLECANCCKTTGPIIEPEEIPIIADALSISPADFLSHYLEMDEDGDFVMQSLPCPMLDLNTNKCKIYEHRPEACRDFPHTNRKDIKQYLDLLEPNKLICPAVEQILERISQKFNLNL